MKRRLLWAFTCLTLVIPTLSSGAVTLVEKDEWKVQMGGFVETDFVRDSKRSFTEVVGNNAVDRDGSFKGDNPRMQSSIRNSRLAFTVLPPEQNEWKTKGYFEFDLLGYDPSVSTAAPTQSEGSFYSNPTMRVRHGFLNAEKNGWTILAGQYWTLFGWQPTYVVTTASVPPGPGVIYQRTPQVTFMKNMMLGETSKLQVGASIARPSQRDAGTPNLDAGVKYSFSGLSAGFASPSGDVKAEPMSIAVSGTMRSFATANSAAYTDGLTKTSGSGLAVDMSIPVLPSSDGKETANTLTLTGEMSAGTGYADAFPSWTGGLPQLPAGSGAANATNLDGGQGGYLTADPTSFQLVKLQSWNAQLQYHLPGDCASFVTLGHSELSASNLDVLLLATQATAYKKVSMNFVNVFHDFTAQIRGAVEYAKFTTTYLDDVTASDDRYQVSAYFRF